MIVGPYQQTTLAISAPTAPKVDGSYTAVVTKGSSNNDVTLVSDTPDVCTVDTNDLVTFLHAANCTLHATEDGTVDLAPGDATTPFTIGPATPTVTVPAPATAVAHGAFTASATLSGHDTAAVTFAAVGSPNDSCHLDGDGTTVHLDHAGDCTVTATAAPSGDGDYLTGSGSSQQFTIGQLSDTVDITSTGPSAAKVNDNYTVTTSGGGSSSAVTLSAGPSTVCTLSGAVVTFAHHGTCTVQADQAGDRDYTAATPDQQQIAIGPAAQAINLTNSPGSPKVDDTFTPQTAAVPSNNPVTFSVNPATTNGACTVDSGEVTYQHVGSCVLDATVAASADGDYAAGTLTLAPITVGKGTPTIGVSPSTTHPVVGDSGTVTATITPVRVPANQFALTAQNTSPTAPCTVTSGGVANVANVQFVHAGSCVVVATLTEPSNGDYNSRTTNTSIVIGKATPTIAVTTPTDGVVGEVVSLTSSSASTGNYSYDSTSPACTTTASGSISLLHHATCAVHVTQATTSDYTTGHATTNLAIGRASTSVAAAITASTLQATVSPVAPSTATPKGKVAFSVDGTGAGTADVGSDGKATLTYSVPTSGGAHSVTAQYLPNDDFLAQSGSTARRNPKLTTTISSSVPKTKYNWYRSPVTVTFACTKATANLSGNCPASHTFTASKANQSITRTIMAQDGGIATKSVTGINIDETKPKVVVAGVTDGTTYIGKAPKARCLPADSLSGVASCRIKLSTDATGKTVYTATATDKAGNTASVTGSYRVQRYYLREAIYDASNNSYIVQTGIDYTLVALAAHRPHYYKPVRLHHTPHVDGGKLSADGRQAGIPRWTLTVSFGRALRKHTFWEIGVLAGGTVHPILLRVT